MRSLSLSFWGEGWGEGRVLAGWIVARFAFFLLRFRDRARLRRAFDRLPALESLLFAGPKRS
ncbi:hypothetical protein, partial [Frateuria sp.]|uniref:hypothetical protein n=1 Tax=Frateuria sp. TaxID=2211372 RepID=UPI0025C565AD